MIWFTSDWHLHHANIIKYCDRPFKNTHFMNKVILEKYHQNIRENDQVYFLGDMTMWGPSHTDRFAPLMQSLPGIKHLILGNHDRFKPFAYHKMGFTSVHTMLHKTFHHENLMFGQADFFMAHDPAWANIPETLWICGHVHEKWKTLKTDTCSIVNVGVDVWDFEPVSLEDVITALQTATRRAP